MYIYIYIYLYIRYIVEIIKSNILMIITHMHMSKDSQ